MNCVKINKELWEDHRCIVGMKLMHSFAYRRVCPVGRILWYCGKSHLHRGKVIGALWEDHLCILVVH